MENIVAYADLKKAVVLMCEVGEKIENEERERKRRWLQPTVSPWKEMMYYG
jgi:hypothetical protein